MYIPNAATQQTKTGNPAYEWFIHSTIWAELTAQQPEPDNGTTQKPPSGDDTSSNQPLREAMLYFCSMDASSGIRPVLGINCLKDKDYEMLNDFADYMARALGVSGNVRFQGENNADATQVRNSSSESALNNTGGV